MTTKTTRCPVMRTWRLVLGVLGVLASPVAAAARAVADGRAASARMPPLGFALNAPKCTPRALAPLGAPCGSGAERRRARRRRRIVLASAADGGEVPAAANGAAQPMPAAGRDVLVLGAGWVGSRLAARLLEDGRRVYVTNRPATAAGTKPAYFRPVALPDSDPPLGRAIFDINVPESWEALPTPESLAGAVVTFALSEPMAGKFWEAYLCRVPNVVCYSSTSVYLVDEPGQLVDEGTPIRNTGRAVAEAGLQAGGATVLTVAGIFGERKSPRGICTCLSTYTSSGGALNGRKRVNMVHVDDIIEATCACLDAPRGGQRINVAGHHFSLSELITHCKHPEVPDGPDTDYSSKCVCSDRLLSEVLPDGFAFELAVPIE